MANGKITVVVGDKTVATYNIPNNEKWEWEDIKFTLLKDKFLIEFVGLRRIKD